jgi:hypothetical protein
LSYRLILSISFGAPRNRRRSLFENRQLQKYLVTRRPDPLQAEMRFAKDARGN